MFLKRVRNSGKTTAFYMPLQRVRLRFTMQGASRCSWIDGPASSLRDLFAFGASPQSSPVAGTLSGCLPACRPSAGGASVDVDVAGT